MPRASGVPHALLGRKIQQSLGRMARRGRERAFRRHCEPTGRANARPMTGSAKQSECHRVVKPGGRIILVNHLYSEKGVAAAIERWAAQRTRALGLRPEFPFARLQAWAQASNDAILVERRKVAPFGIYTLVCFERAVPAAA